MKLCLSNIAWEVADNDDMYSFMEQNGITGLEIAPTKLFGENPYDNPKRCAEYALGLKNRCGLAIVSMQSLWYGRSERIFGGKEERAALFEYSKKAIDAAAAVGCPNMVFGSPKNRVMGKDGMSDIAAEFFLHIGEYAASKGVRFALEANPKEYGTDFLNTTQEAINFCRRLCCSGLSVNLDVGTMICNGETAAVAADNLDIISHVHISEPWLVPLVERDLHKRLRETLERGSYGGYVSVEMTCAGREAIKIAANYLSEVFA